MPQYRAIRQRYSFLEMCHQPELIAEVTRLPLDILGVDAAILFSDILVIPEALQVGLRFEDKVGPLIDRPVRTVQDIKNLPPIHAAEALAYVGQGIQLIKQQIVVPLIGFCGAPFTIASYMVEGGSSRDLKRTKQWMLQDKASFHQLLDIITLHTIDYLKMQIRAGVNALQIFDSWANYLAHTQFREFSLAYLKRILDAIKSENVPVILFCRGSSVFASQLAELAPAGISIDWNADLATVRRSVPSTIALQGNLDPDILYAPHTVIRQEVQQLLQSMKGDPGYIFNLGHGLAPDMTVDSVRTLVDTVKEYS
jgi:uroporphyrinogen decarboxylase